MELLGMKTKKSPMRKKKNQESMTAMLWVREMTQGERHTQLCNLLLDEEV